MSEVFEFYGKSSNEPVLTHGDLSSLNILVRADEAVAIVDWETAGWFSLYWEDICTENANPLNGFWADEIDGFLDPMLYEPKMEAIRRKYFGVFGMAPVTKDTKTASSDHDDSSQRELTKRHTNTHLAS